MCGMYTVHVNAVTGIDYTTSVHCVQAKF